MFTVYLHNSTVTPSQPGYGQLMDSALLDVGAEPAGPGGVYRLRDEAELYLFRDPKDDIALVEFPVRTEAVAEAIYQVAERTGSLLMSHPSDGYAYRTPGNPGEPPAQSALAISGVGVIETISDLHDILGELAPHPIEALTPPAATFGPVKRGLFQRLSDTIFGRAV